MVNHANTAARDLLEREGYTPVGYRWRFIIKLEDGESAPLAFDVASPRATGVTRIYEPSGRYVVRQYDVHEKELRAGEHLARASLLKGSLLAACRA